VINRDEQKKDKLLCYYHAKVRDGLITKSHYYKEQIDWESRNEIRRKYLGYPKVIVEKHVRQKEIDEIGIGELLSVANEALLRVCSNPNVVSSYVYNHIKGAVINHVRTWQASGLTGVSYHKWLQFKNKELNLAKKNDVLIFNILQHGIVSMNMPIEEDTEEEFTLDDIIPSDEPTPEQSMLLKEITESQEDLPTKHRLFVQSLNRIERYVWRNHVLKRKATRDVAGGIDKSHMTVARVAKRIRLKFLNYWFPERGDTYKFYRKLI
jgi:hypothetical protein